VEGGGQGATETAGDGAERAAGDEGAEGEAAEGSDPVDESGTPAEPMPLLLPVLAQLARPGCALRTLELSRSAVSLATATLLGRVLVTTPLEALKLNHCNIQDDSLLAIAEGLSQNRLLLEIQLRGNKLSGAPSAPAALLDAAGRHARLAHLDLADNLLKSQCVEELCAALRWSCSLVAIHLLSYALMIPDAPAITAACRSWLEENVREADVIGRGGAMPTAGATPKSVATDVASATTAAMATAPAAGLAASPAAAPKVPMEKGESDIPPLCEELILCRALHVAGLGSWRVASPAPKSTPSPLGTLEEAQTVQRSFMPSCCWVCSHCSPVDYQWIVPDSGEGDETGARTARIFVRPSFADFSRVELMRQHVAGAKHVRYAARLLVPPGCHSHVFEAVVGGKTQILYARGENSVELGDAKLTDAQRDVLERLCRQHHCTPRLNLLKRVEGEGFQIPESLHGDASPEPAVGDWEDDPERRRRFRQCYEVDLRELHLSDLCHAEEEEEVLETLWELYPRLYETYAAFAGRSSWPLVRHVDVYSFFDEARLLERAGPLAASDAASTLEEDDLSMELQDVQQMILQTFAPVQRGRGTGRRRGSVGGGTGSGMSGSGASVAGAMLATSAVPGAGSVEGPNTPDALSSWAATVHQRTREGAPITRPQFIEVLLRAAIALCGGHPSTSLAFQKFVDRVISRRVMQPPLAPFPRGLPLQAGEVADTLLARRKTLREAWERFGCSGSSFQRLAQLMKLCDRSFTAEHVSSIYAIARRPQADFRETRRRSPGLGYDEFCEAVARLALVWQRTLRTDGAVGGKRKWPPQPQVGRPVRQIAVAGRIEAFLAKLAERMRPSIVPSSVL